MNQPTKNMWHNAKRRANRFNIKFEIEVVDIVLPDLCPCCRKPFVLGAPTGRPVPQAPSLDRFKPDLGYVPGNIGVICHRCNTLKRDATANELLDIANWMAEHDRQAA